MSNTGWNTQQTSSLLDKLELVNKIPIFIPDDLRDKIKFLCKSIKKDEWSGVLFYKMQGSMRKPATVKITLLDILLMDRGSATYTSFDWDEDVVNYQMDNPEAMDWHIGHIHSHNTMDVFFSGTDWSELNDNCPQHNFYLSVIVNNYTDVKAKIAFTGQSNSYVCKDETGKDYTLNISNSTKAPVMLVYDCDIHINDTDIVVPEDFNNRVTIIEEKSKAKKVEEERKRKEKAAANNTYSKQGVKNPALLKSSTAKFPSYTGRNHEQKNHNSSLWGNFQREEKEFFQEDKEEEFTKQTIEQEFATYVLRLGNNEELIDDELEDALEDIENAKINIPSLSDSIVDTYGALYDRFFERITKYHGDEPFLEVLDKVIEALEEHEENYTFLTVITEKLKQMGNKFENFIKGEIHETAT